MTGISNWEVGGRKLSTIAGALVQRRHYHALRQMFRVCGKPHEFLGRYLLGLGKYPALFDVRTPAGWRKVTLYSHHDLLTVNEIFCREDYAADQGLRIVVDFGSNIGLSAFYFLTRNRNCRVFCYEPVPRNGERLLGQLSEFSDRFQFEAVCVGTHNGQVRFGVEETGRYGGIGVATGKEATFPCRDVNSILADVFASDVSEIDILKSDMEGIDEAVLKHVRPEYLARIRVIYAEMIGTGVSLPGFRQSQRGLISKWERT